MARQGYPPSPIASALGFVRLCPAPTQHRPIFADGFDDFVFDLLPGEFRELGQEWLAALIDVDDLTLIDLRLNELIDGGKDEGFEMIGEHIEAETGKGSDALDQRPVVAAELWQTQKASSGRADSLESTLLVLSNRKLHK